MDKIIGRAVKIAFIAAAIVCLGLFFKGKSAWAGGMLFGLAWMTVNLILTVNLLKVAIFQKPKTGLWLYLLIKFPLLYSLLVVVLLYKVFSPVSILAGIGLSFVCLGVARLCL